MGCQLTHGWVLLHISSLRARVVDVPSLRLPGKRPWPGMTLNSAAAASPSHLFVRSLREDRMVPVEEEKALNRYSGI
jgi:hypothetical protein